VRVATALTLCLGAAAAAGATTFADHLKSPFEQPLAQALAESIGRGLPVAAASAGVVFSFDPASGAFVRETSVLGQLFLERAAPLGRGRWNLSLSYQRVKTETLEGEDLGGLHDTSPPILDPSGAAFTIPRFGIDLVTHEVTASATYGVTDDLEVNLTVPVLYSDFGLDIRFVDLNRGKVLVDHVRSSKLGVGDVLVRGKYRVLARDWAQAALGLVLRLPSGNQDNFQGTGTTEVAPMLYLSREASAVTKWLRLQPYLNAGVNFVTEDVEGSEARSGLGLDATIAGRFSGAVAFLARQPFRQVGPRGLFDVRRTNGTTAPLFGITNARPDFFDLSVGGRLSVWRDAVILFANAIVPLNSDGFRSNVIPLVGVEAAF